MYQFLLSFLLNYKFSSFYLLITYTYTIRHDPYPISYSFPNFKSTVIFPVASTLEVIVYPLDVKSIEIIGRSEPLTPIEPPTRND